MTNKIDISLFEKYPERAYKKNKDEHKLTNISRTARYSTVATIALPALIWLISSIGAPATAQAQILLGPLKSDWLYAQQVRLTFRQDDALWSPDDYVDPNGSGSWWATVYENRINSNVDLFMHPYVYDRTSPRYRRELQLTTHPANDLYPHMPQNAENIVFTSDRDGNYNLFTVNPKTLEKEQITSHPALDTLPKWSPDGKHIAFISTRGGDAEIYLLRLEDKGLTQLTDNDLDDVFVEWSPDGAQLLWVQIQPSEDDEENQEPSRDRYLHVMNMDGSNQQRISGNLPYAQHLAWSPDWQSIALDYDSNNDGANDTALLTLNTGTIEILEVGINNIEDDYPDVPENERLNFAREYWVNGWSPDGELWTTGVEYSFVGTRLTFGIFSSTTLIDTPPLDCCVRSASPARLINQGITNVVVKNSDSKPSKTWVKPLPAYSRGPDLLLNIYGYDPGYAGLSQIQLFGRDGSDSTWPDFNHAVRELNGPLKLEDPLTMVYEGFVGETVALKSLSKDRAENRELWLPDDAPEAETTLYRWRLSGMLTDNRGYPLSQQQVPLTPSVMNEPVTDSNGLFNAYVDFSFQYSVTQHVAVNADIDLQQNSYIGTSDQHLLETGPITLKTDCSGLCLTNETIDFNCNPVANPSCVAPEMELNPSFQAMVPDSVGGMHLLWHENDTNYHRYRSQDGTWSEKEMLFASSDVGSIDGVADSTDQLHALFVVFQNGQKAIYHMIKEPNKPWSERQLVGYGVPIQLLSDAHGELHLLYSCTESDCDNITQLFYQKRKRNGVWQAAEEVIAEDDLSTQTQQGVIYLGDMAVEKDGTAHFAYRSTEFRSPTSQPRYRKRTTAGKWTLSVSTISTLSTYETAPMQLQIDEAGTLQLFWVDDPQWFYAHQMVGTAWSSPYVVAKNEVELFSHFDTAQTFHLFKTSYENGKFQLESQYLPQGGIWSQRVRLTDIGGGGDELNSSSLVEITLDSNNNPHVLINNENQITRYYTSYSAPPAQEPITNSATVKSMAIYSTTTYSTTIEVPADLNRPTLSFLYNIYNASLTEDGLREGSAPEDRFIVSIDSGATDSPVFTATTTVVGNVGWIALDEFAGETITATFELQTRNDASLSYIQLQSLALDSWITPRLDKIEPSTIDANQPNKITVIGENFLDRPTVSLSGQQITNISLVSPERLEITIPDNLAIGRYNIEVTNQGSTQTTLYGALQIGEILYLPYTAN